MTWRKKHIQESVSYEFCAGDAVATPVVQQLPSLVGLSKRQFWVCNLHVPCNDDGFILKCFWWCSYRGWHSSMLLIFQTWVLTKVSNIWYTCIYDIKIERERAVLFDTYIYIYIYTSQEWQISPRNCRRLNRFCTHILKPVRKKTLASCEFS